MPLSYTKPDPQLLRELEAAAAHADELRQALKANVVFPDDFPFGEIELLTGTLAGLPNGTAEGCKEILDYSRVRLADIGQRFVRHEDEIEDTRNDVPPGLARGMAVDRAIGALLTSISYAQAEYARQSGEAIEDDSGAEASVRPSSDLASDLADLRSELQSVEGETEQLGRKIEAESLPGSEQADDLQRQVRDAGGHVGIARNELQQPAPRPGRLERIQRVLAQLPNVIERTGKAMKLGIDIAEPFADQWLNKLPTDIFNLVVKHLRLVAENVEKAGQRLKAGRQPPARTGEHPPFTIFRDIDAPWCPEMVMLPAGTFLMGSPDDEEGRNSNELQQRQVTLRDSFALGRYPVTFDEYDHFCAETGWRTSHDEGWGRGRRPVIMVRHEDAEAYCAWLSGVTGSTYQLPSEAMWEYACRAGVTTAYSFGTELTENHANFGGIIGKTSEVGAYPPNRWGLYDMHGNVRELCRDWYYDDHEGATDFRALRGGSCIDDMQHVRAACRDAYISDTRRPHGGPVGFRCARVQEA